MGKIENFKILEWAVRIGILPYSWDPNTNVVKPSDKGLKRFHFKFNLIIYAAYTAFLVFRLLQAIAVSSSFAVVSDIQAILSLALAAASFYFALNRNSDSIAHFISRVLEFNHSNSKFLSDAGVVFGTNMVRPEHQDAFEAWKSLAAKVMKLGFIVGAAYTARLLRKPEKLYHVSSLLENPRDAPVVLKVLITIGHMYVWVIQIYVLLFWLILILNLTTTFLFTLRYLGRLNDGPYGANRGLFLKYYSQLEILQLEMNSYWKGFHTCFILSFMVGFILNVYQLVIHHWPKAIVILLAGSYVLRKFIKLVAEHHDESLRVLKSWEREVNSPWFRKYVRSRRALETQNGGFGYLDNTLLLTLVRIVVENSITLIIARR